jgi:protein-S-isoprenylcysteine O-methyltransferase Ste14
MDKKLLLKALTKLVSGMSLVALLLFPAAGTPGFLRGWLLMGVLFLPMTAAGFVMLFRAPELLRRRLNANEQEQTQRWVIALSGLMFAAAFLLAGLDYRFGWSSLPGWVSAAACLVFLLGYGMFAVVLRENVWLSRTVEVQKGQQVVDTGLYAVVRHPMYSATLLLFLSMPLILGSLVSFAVMLLYLPILYVRIRNEERVLEQGLSGYTDYQRRVRYRLIPFLW